MKFDSVAKRDLAITTSNRSKNALAETSAVMNKDRPIQERTRFSFLLGLKKLFASWGIHSTNFEEDTGTFEVAGVKVLHVEINNFVSKLFC